MMNGEKSLNFFIKAMLKIMREKYPKVMRNCPFSGRSEFQNFTVGQDFFRIVPTGVFRIVIKQTFQSNISDTDLYMSSILTAT